MRSARFWLAGALFVVIVSATLASVTLGSLLGSRNESRERARDTLSTPLPNLDRARLKSTLVEVHYGPGESSALIPIPVP